MKITINDDDWLLIQFSGTDREVAHGPFKSADLAWRYLFGRESTAEERAKHERAKWRVVQAYDGALCESCRERREDDDAT